MILSAFTLLHVLISLVAIGTGLIVLYGMLTGHRFDGWTGVFLSTTVLTSVTGFMFPIHKFTPGLGVGILSMVLLAIAIAARYRLDWPKTYVVTSILSLYFNVFVLIVQLFQKVPALKELAPTQSEPPFAITQLSVLVLFLACIVMAVMRTRSGVLKTA